MRIFVISILISLLIAIDSITKWYFNGYFQSKVLDCFSLVPECLYHYFPIFGEYFGIQLSYNYGIAFSLPITGLPLQILTLLLISGLIFHYIREEYPKKSLLIDTGYLFIFSGACSHAFERIYHGYVVDFISLKYFAIFNIADILISIGAILIIIVYAVASRRHR